MNADEVDKEGIPGRSAAIANGLGIFSVLVSEVVFNVAMHANGETHRFLATFSAIAFAAFLTLTPWSAVLAVRALIVHENTDWPGLVLCACAVELTLVLSAMIL